MADTITLTAEELKELFEPLFELISKKEKLIVQLFAVIEERDAEISKMEDDLLEFRLDAMTFPG